MVSSEKSHGRIITIYDLALKDYLFPVATHYLTDANISDFTLIPVQDEKISAKYVKGLKIPAGIRQVTFKYVRK